MAYMDTIILPLFACETDKQKQSEIEKGKLMKYKQPANTTPIVIQPLLNKPKYPPFSSLEKNGAKQHPTNRWHYHKKTNHQRRKQKREPATYVLCHYIPLSLLNHPNPSHIPWTPCLSGHRVAAEQAR